MGEDKFEEDKFMKMLVNLKDTQESIQKFSGWCIHNRKSAYKMARCWIKVIKKVRVEQKLVLFHLVNDIVQHSAKKGFTELLDKFKSGIKESMPHLKEEKIAYKVQRCLTIWDEREVFDADYIQELSSLIDMTPVKEDQEIVENFQPNQLCLQVKIMKALEDDSDFRLKTLKENDMDNKDIEEIKARLKDKHCGDEYVSEFEDGAKKMVDYIRAMEREISKRKQVIELLSQGKKYYDSLYGEAEIVATAYSNFGNRVKKVQQKLEEKLPELAQKAEARDSPVPSPDYDAPSPQGEDEMELRLPDEEDRHTPPDLASRLSSMHHSAFSNEIRQNLPPPPPPPPNPYVAEIQKIPSNNISDFLTKIAHGEKLDIDGFIGGGRMTNNGEHGIGNTKRRRLDSPEHYTAAHRSLPAMTPPYTPIERVPPSLTPPPFSAPPPPPPAPPPDSWHYQLDNNSNSSGHSHTQESRSSGNSYRASTKNAADPWDEPVPEWLQGSELDVVDSDDDDEEEEEEAVVENLALKRLKQAPANKSKGSIGSSNLISLTGSPVVRGGSRRSRERHREEDDMDLSDGEDGEIREQSPDRHRRHRDRRDSRDSYEHHSRRRRRSSSSPSPSSRYERSSSQRGSSSGWGSTSRHDSPPPSNSDRVKQTEKRNSESDKKEEDPPPADNKPKTLFGIPLVPLEKKEEPPKPPPIDPMYGGGHAFPLGGFHNFPPPPRFQGFPPRGDPPPMIGASGAGSHRNGASAEGSEDGTSIGEPGCGFDFGSNHSGQFQSGAPRFPRGGVYRPPFPTGGGPRPMGGFSPATPDRGGHRGGFDRGRGLTPRGGRGNFDSGRGGGGFEGHNNRGGFEGHINRGGFEGHKSRGGFDGHNSRGGLDAPHRGGFEGGFQNRGRGGGFNRGGMQRPWRGGGGGRGNWA